MTKKTRQKDNPTPTIMEPNNTDGSSQKSMPASEPDTVPLPGGTGVEQPADNVLEQNVQQQLTDLNDRLLRSRAELENYRKRVQRDAAEREDLVKAAAVQEFLGVYDHLVLAAAHVDQTPDVQAVKQGLGMILGEFERALERIGIKRIDAMGEVFDPNRHEALAQLPAADVPEGQVVEQWKCGFVLGEKLLRPVGVVVSPYVDAVIVGI